MLLMEVSKCWKIVESQKISIKMKNFSKFLQVFKVFSKAQTASRIKEIT